MLPLENKLVIPRIALIHYIFIGLCGIFMKNTFFNPENFSFNWSLVILAGTIIVHFNIYIHFLKVSGINGIYSPTLLVSLLFVIFGTSLYLLSLMFSWSNFYNEVKFCTILGTLFMLISCVIHLYGHKYSYQHLKYRIEQLINAKKFQVFKIPGTDPIKSSWKLRLLLKKTNDGYYWALAASKHDEIKNWIWIVLMDSDVANFDCNELPYDNFILHTTRDEKSELRKYFPINNRQGFVNTNGVLAYNIPEDFKISKYEWELLRSLF